MWRSEPSCRTRPGRRWFGAALLVCLSGCSSLPALPGLSGSPSAAGWGFEVIGRFSATHGDGDRREAVQGRFRWVATETGDQVELSSPLGQILARISASDTGARLERAGGEAFEAASVSDLTRELLGWPLPVRTLRHWMLVRPGDASVASVSAAPDGGVQSIEESGWRIDYPDPRRQWLPGGIETDAGGVARRLNARFDGTPVIDVRLVVEQVIGQLPPIPPTPSTVGRRQP